MKRLFVIAIGATFLLSGCAHNYNSGSCPYYSSRTNYRSSNTNSHQHHHHDGGREHHEHHGGYDHGHGSEHH